MSDISKGDQRRNAQHAKELDRMIAQNEEARKTLADNAKKFKLTYDLMAVNGGTPSEAHNVESNRLARYVEAITEA